MDDDAVARPPDVITLDSFDEANALVALRGRCTIFADVTGQHCSYQFPGDPETQAALADVRARRAQVEPLKFLAIRRKLRAAMADELRAARDALLASDDWELHAAAQLADERQRARQVRERPNPYASLQRARAAAAASEWRARLRAVSRGQQVHAPEPSHHGNGADGTEG